MIEIPQYIVNWIMLGASGIFGWWARQMWERHNKLSDDVSALALKMAEQYVTLHRMEQLEKAIFQRLDKIQDLLVSKADK